MSEPVINEAFPCNECQAGLMRLQYITYFTWLGEELITVPNFPAWVCDMCGRREYDERAVHWITALLHPDAGHAAPHRVKLPHRPSKRPALRPAPPE